MANAPTRLVNLARRIVRKVREVEVSFVAAGIAYYTLISLVPIAVAGIVLTSKFGGLGSVLAGVVDPATLEAVRSLAGEAASTGSGSSGAAVGAAVVAVWGSIRLVRGIDLGFARVYETPGSKSIRHRLRDIVVVLFALGVGFALTVAIGVATAHAGFRFIGIGGAIGLLVGLTLVFLPLYYVLPDADLALDEALPGALLAAAGWVLLQTAFRLYAVHYGTQSGLYGVLGGVLLLVTWLYFGGHVLLLGAAVNAVLSGYD